MNTQRLKKTMRLIVVVFIICLANTFRLLGDTNIRMVDMLSLIALGMALGILIVTIRLYFTFKSKEESK